jgi:hypothetical protein
MRAALQASACRLTLCAVASFFCLHCSVIYVCTAQSAHAEVAGQSLLAGPFAPFATCRHDHSVKSPTRFTAVQTGDTASDD